MLFTGLYDGGNPFGQSFGGGFYGGQAQQPQMAPDLGYGGQQSPWAINNTNLNPQIGTQTDSIGVYHPNTPWQGPSNPWQAQYAQQNGMMGPNTGMSQQNLFSPQIDNSWEKGIPVDSPEGQARIAQMKNTPTISGGQIGSWDPLSQIFSPYNQQAQNNYQQSQQTLKNMSGGYSAPQQGPAGSMAMPMVPANQMPLYGFNQNGTINWGGGQSQQQNNPYSFSQPQTGGQQFNPYQSQGNSYMNYSPQQQSQQNPFSNGGSNNNQMAQLQAILQLLQSFGPMGLMSRMNAPNQFQGNSNGYWPGQTGGGTFVSIA